MGLECDKNVEGCAAVPGTWIRKEHYTTACYNTRAALKRIEGKSTKLYRGAARNDDSVANIILEASDQNTIRIVSNKSNAVLLCKRAVEQRKKELPRNLEAFFWKQTGSKSDEPEQVKLHCNADNAKRSAFNEN